MSLTVGKGPFGHRPGGLFGHPKLLHEHGRLPAGQPGTTHHRSGAEHEPDAR